MKRKLLAAIEEFCHLKILNGETNSKAFDLELKKIRNLQDFKNIKIAKKHGVFILSTQEKSGQSRNTKHKSLVCSDERFKI